MKGQKLVNRHRFEVIRFHFFNPDDLPPCRRLPPKTHLGDWWSGYHEWKTLFKKEHFKVILPCYRVSASHFKLKLQDDLLTRPVQQLMGDALDDPEPGASR